MKLHSLKIEGFKRIKEATVLFGDATFLIGSNNSGKSSTLQAIKYLLSNSPNIPSTEFYSEIDEETGATIPVVEQVLLEAEFRNVPQEALNWKGFKGRVFRYDVPEDSGETGLSIFYRKTYKTGQKAKIELKSHGRTIKPEFMNCRSLDDYAEGHL
ncbi:MAG: DUF2813 domain-containing protein [Alphaproteobacteria bacterium]|nr:DUF2813 domain-containing protein [Alphaproteobacteria bacterium]